MQQMQQMHKLIDFNEVQTLQIDQIYSMFISLVKTINEKPKDYSSGFICPHTVLCNLQKMKPENEKCNICPTQKYPNIKFQLSGILFFLLGGHKEGQGSVEEFYTYGKDYFSQYGILEEDVLQKLFFLLNETEFEKKKKIYDQIKTLNDGIQPQIYTHELKKYCIIIVDLGLGFLYNYKDLDEITLAISFKIFMEEYIKLINSLQLRLDDFKICIHNLFYGSKTNSYFTLKFNLFYDYLCNCNQKKFSLLFYQYLINQNYQKSSGSQYQSLANDVKELIKRQNEENDFAELLNLLQQYQKNQQSLALSSFLTKYISFFSREILKQLKELTNNLLWKGYKVLFQQEIIELIENQFIKNNITSSLLSNQLFEQYKAQVLVKLVIDIKYLRIQLNLVRTYFFKYNNKIF